MNNEDVKNEFTLDNQKVLPADNSVVATQEPEKEEQKADLDDQVHNRRLKVGIIGGGVLGSFYSKVFTKDVITEVFDKESGKMVDDAIAAECDLYFVCVDIPFAKNGLQDDAEIIDIAKKLDQDPGKPGVCIKSTLAPETVMRIFGQLSEESQKGRFIYSPELGDSKDFNGMINQRTHIVGGSPEVASAHISLINDFTFLDSREMITCTVMDAAFINLGISDYVATLQSFWNQFYDCVSDYNQSVNYQQLRKVLNTYVEDHPTNAYGMPAYLRSMANEEVSFKKARTFGGEYLNNDVAALVSMTEKMPIVDYIIEQRNIGD